MKKTNHTRTWALIAFLTTIHACAAGTLIPLQGKGGHNPGAVEAAEHQGNKTADVKG